MVRDRVVIQELLLGHVELGHISYGRYPLKIGDILGFPGESRFRADVIQLGIDAKNEGFSCIGAVWVSVKPIVSSPLTERIPANNRGSKRVVAPLL